jgi:hypothetical protein
LKGKAPSLPTLGRDPTRWAATKGPQTLRTYGVGIVQKMTIDTVLNCPKNNNWHGFLSADAGCGPIVAEIVYFILPNPG